MIVMTYLTCISCHAWIRLVTQSAIISSKQYVSENYKIGPVIAVLLWNMLSGKYLARVEVNV